jgi:ABC-type bacteriocin/lantibiotic exporter with double-glycine peptidase domain
MLVIRRAARRARVYRRWSGATMARQRRLFAPATVQTSAMDCGPAALHALLRGLGLHASYDRLRQACHTDVDGSSISALQEAAAGLGVQATELMLPPEHVGEALPCIAAVKTASGLPHFVVIWRRLGRLYLVLDPAVGRRLLTRAGLERWLYRHEQEVPAVAWTAYVRDRGFVAHLVRRLGQRGLRTRHAVALVDSAAHCPGWESLSALDAAIRADSGGRRRALPRLQAALAGAARLPAEAWSVCPRTGGPTAAAREPVLVLRGAVIVHAGGRAAAPVDPGALPAALAAALQESSVSPLRRLFGAAVLGAPARWLLLALLLVVMGPVVVAEASLLRWAARAAHDPGSALLVAAAAGLAVFALELCAVVPLLAAGRRLERHLRGTLASKLARLDDEYVRTRPVADLAERVHALHDLRGVPTVLGQLLLLPAGLVAVCAAIASVHAFAGALALVGTLMLLGIAAGAHVAVREVEVRLREHAGTVLQTGYDAWRGAAVVRASAGQHMIRGLQRERLDGYARAAARAARLRAVAVGAQLSTATAVTVTVLATALPSADTRAQRVLLVLWALSLPWFAERLAHVGLANAFLRARAIRLAEPLTAPQIDPPAQPSARAGGAGIELRAVTLRRGEISVLDDVTLAIKPGQKVALVGTSGSGKTSLCELLLGFQRPTEGELLLDGGALDDAAAGALRATTAWVCTSARLWDAPVLENLARRPDTASAIATLKTLGAARLAARGASIGDDGALLSSRQAQLLRLARALERPVVRLAILDEPLRGLPASQRAHMFDVLHSRWANATIVCALHELEDALRFDRVVVLDDGRIVESGSPVDLAAADGPFAAMLDDRAALLHARADSRRARSEAHPRQAAGEAIG